jgi:hypothetical protein
VGCDDGGGDMWTISGLQPNIEYLLVSTVLKKTHQINCLKNNVWLYREQMLWVREWRSKIYVKVDIAFTLGEVLGH